MKLPIYLYGSKVLRENAQEADLSDREKLTQLIADMEETLASADGCGLAAPQVGVPVRVLIVDGRDLTDAYPYLKDFKRVMINPVVVEESRETCDYSEGCLSEVVLPLCGYDVKLPSNEVGDYYDRLLKETVGWGMEGFQKDSSPVELST